MIERICEQCGIKFETKSKKAKYCSNKCKKITRILKEDKKKIDRICKQCGKIYRRLYEKSGFCSRSCGSKWHIKHGTFNKWRFRKNELKGRYMKCPICEKEKYVKPGYKGVACCSKKCRYKYVGKLMTGTNNPSFGKGQSKEAKQKQLSIMVERYGVTNAWQLAKHRHISRPHKEIYYELIKSFPTDGFITESLIRSGTSSFHIDILSEKLGIAIEYNGNYWHCNPSMYDSSFINHKKKMTAEEIWKYDEKRLNHIRQIGYDTIVVWENDYKKSPFDVIESLKNSIKNRKNEE